MREWLREESTSIYAGTRRQKLNQASRGTYLCQHERGKSNEEQTWKRIIDSSRAASLRRDGRRAERSEEKAWRKKLDQDSSREGRQCTKTNLAKIKQEHWHSK